MVSHTQNKHTEFIRCWNGLPFGHNVTWAEAYLRTNWYPDPYNCLATVHQHYTRTGQWSRSV